MEPGKKQQHKGKGGKAGSSRARSPAWAASPWATLPQPWAELVSTWPYLAGLLSFPSASAAECENVSGQQAALQAQLILSERLKDLQNFLRI